MNKLEYFETTLAETSGDDLAKIFWLNSKNAEVGKMETNGGREMKEGRRRGRRDEGGMKEG
jgi:hypothetical protein